MNNRPTHLPRLVDGMPRRNRVDHNTPAEHAIRAVVQLVERLGAHVLLTEAVNLLHAAREKIADWAEGVEPPAPAAGEPPACCYAPADAEPAHYLYAAYNAAGERRGLNFAGQPCPEWASLPADVQTKWRAVAIAAGCDGAGGGR